MDLLERDTIYPFKHQEIINYYYRLRKNFWSDDEIQYKKEDKIFDMLDPTIKDTIKKIFSYFLTGDKQVLENLIRSFIDGFNIPEVSAVFLEQASQEVVHRITYEKTICCYFSNDELENIMAFNFKVLVAKRKVQWLDKWTDSTLGEKLLAYTFTEWLSFQPSFAFIFWLKEKHPLSAIIISNEFISRDETLHVEFQEFLEKKFQSKLNTNETMYKTIIEQVVENEIDWWRWVMEVRDSVMNFKNIVEYVKYLADVCTMRRGYSCIYKAKNPFPFVAGQVKTESNFFEVTPTNYSAKTNTVINKNQKIDFDFDFLDHE